MLHRLVWSLGLFILSACGVETENSTPFAQSQATYFCPGPFRYNATSKLCESNSEALGPFTVAMQQRCVDAGGGAGCAKDEWDLSFARKIRGNGSCPLGATVVKNLCIEGDRAFGPFTFEHVVSCRENNGGMACTSMRWEKDFAIAILPKDAFTFPLKSAALASYLEAPRSFGSCRDNCTRKHAGADLYAYTGTPVLAVGDGEVIDFYEFYLGTYALVVDHGAFVVRYGEIKANLPSGVYIGAQIRQGQGIAYVGRLQGLSQDMVHFERYAGWAGGPLTERDNYPYQRRADLVDPTQDLIAWKYPR